jgi:hypothetical protein
MIQIDQLQQLDPAAWTAVLGRKTETRGVIATNISHEPLDYGRNVVRYHVTLAGHSDPVTFIGKRTNAAETLFYRELAPEIAPLAPECWFSQIQGQQGWIVLDEAYSDYRPQGWTHRDVEAVLDDLASLHAEYWEQDSFLRLLGWLPQRFNQTARETINSPTQVAQFRYLAEQGASISEHAIRTAGRLSPLFIKASAGLDMLREWGGWPMVLGEKHLRAAAELLDDPVPVIQPLRELPMTLLHGNPAPTNWRLSLVQERRLLDWQNLSIGPAVCDLVCFMEQFELVRDEEGNWQRRLVRPASEETIIDGYILSMSRKAGRSFNARLLRQAIPAARCLYVITSWLPCFADWFQRFPSGRHAWQKINQMSDEQLVAAGYARLANLRPYLAGVFNRFLTAYRTL